MPRLLALLTTGCGALPDFNVLEEMVDRLISVGSNGSFHLSSTDKAPLLAVPVVLDPERVDEPGRTDAPAEVFAGPTYLEEPPCFEDTFKSNRLYGFTLKKPLYISKLW